VIASRPPDLEPSMNPGRTVGPRGGLQRRAVILFVILAVGLMLRLFHLDRQSLWYDEVVVYDAAIQPTLAEVVGPTFGYPEPELHQVVLHYWLRLSDSDAHARLLSVVFGVATIYLFYRLFQLMFSHTVGLIAAGLLAVNPFHVWYSQEVRMYTMFVFFVSLSTLLLWKAIHAPGWRLWLAYAAAAVLCGLSHFTAALVVAGHALFALLHPNRRAVIGRLAVALTIAGLVMVPVALNFARGGHRPHQMDKPFALATAAYAVFAQSVGFSFGPSIYQIQRQTSLVVVKPYAAQVAVAAVVFLVPLTAGVLTLYRSRSDAARAQRALVVAMPGAVLGLAFLMDAVSSATANPRHVSANLLPYLGVLGLGIWRLGGRAGTAAFASVALVSAVSLSGYYFDERYAKEDARGAAVYLERYVGTRTPILVLSYPEPLHRYLPALRLHGQATIGHAPDRPDLHQRLLSLVGHSEQFVLVDLRAWQFDPDGLVESTCDRLLRRSVETRFHGVRIIEYQNPRAGSHARATRTTPRETARLPET
jgi:uncharacterized membrane protein